MKPHLQNLDEPGTNSPEHLSRRKDAIQSKTITNTKNVALMVENMPSNKAYRYATENGDPDGRILEDFRSRYIAYRKAWKNQPRQAINNKLTGNKFEQARFTPLSVDIEVAAVCDLACPFCYRQHILTPDKVIDPDLYESLIDQCAEMNVPSVKLNWRGEPLLHPNLPEFVDYAKRKGILEVIINTNATTLDVDKSRNLIEAGLDQIIYSFDGGTPETYESMRVGRFKKNSFELVYSNIKNFAQVRNELGSIFPRTKIQMILTDKAFNEQERFHQLFTDCVDDVSVKAYTERGGNLEDLDQETLKSIEQIVGNKTLGSVAHWRDMTGRLFVSKGRLPCEQPFQRLMVTYDGRVSMCCYDWGSEHPVGYTDQSGYTTYGKDLNAIQESIDRGKAGFAKFMSTARYPKTDVKPLEKVETLEQIWFGDIIDEVRRKHCSDKVGEVDICTRCPFKETYNWIEIDN